MNQPAAIVASTPDAAAARGRGRRRAMLTSIVVFSVVVHVVALILFGAWVVARYFATPEAVFEMKPDLRIPPEPPEHRLNMARHQAMAPKPTMKKRLVSTRPAAIALPEMPEVEVDQTLVMDPANTPGLNAASLAGGAAGFASAEGLTGGGGTGSGMSFFGIRDRAASVVIMIDVSDSMFGRTGDLDYGTRKLVRQGGQQSFQRIRDEAVALIDGLGIDARFGVIRWSGSARSWKPALVPATDENKLAAKEHILNEVDAFTARPTGGRPGGTRHDYALEELLKLSPEVAYLLSDGNATRSVGGRLEEIPERELVAILEQAREAGGKVPKLHTIYYLTGADKREEERMLRRLAQATGGESRKVKAERRRD
jgi:hypothetical protein